MERVFVPCQHGCLPPPGRVAPARGQGLVLGDVSPAKTQHSSGVSSFMQSSHPVTNTWHTADLALPQGADTISRCLVAAQ